MYKAKALNAESNNKFLVTNKKGDSKEFGFDVISKEAYPLSGDAEGFEFEETRASIIRYRIDHRERYFKNV